ncbi:MAG: hypothetical protein HOI80_01090, partial [Alphaproteobacteria bacterium]|nr:hypothetical protein [Alphaproteobacteria bacterium]
GVIIGLMVDHFFGTSPWGLIGFFILGSLAGFLNMYRTLFHNSGFFVGLERSTKYDDPTENNQSEKPDEKK